MAESSPSCIVCKRVAGVEKEVPESERIVFMGETLCPEHGALAMQCAADINTRLAAAGVPVERIGKLMDAAAGVRLIWQALR